MINNFKERIKRDLTLAGIVIIIISVVILINYFFQ
jgi:hypothetical protein